MKRSLIISVLFCIFILCCFSNGKAQIAMHGGRGLLRVQSANVVAPADIYINAIYSNFFEKIGPERLATLHTLYLNGTVGLGKNVEMGLHFVAYQEDQDHILGRYGDTRLAIKYLIPFSNSFFQMGIQSLVKFPTAFQSNVRYEVFSTEKVALASSALFTLDFSDFLSSSPFKFYANVGYFDHDVTDQYFKAECDQMVLGSGVKFSIRAIQVFLEYSGEIFVNNRDSISFRENSTRLASGMKFLGPKGLTVDLAGEIGFADDPQKGYRYSEYSYIKKYSDWRAWLGVTYRFSVFKYFDKRAKIARQKREQEQRKLERIKRKRIGANKDIERMKKILDEKNKKKKKNN